MIGKMKYIKYTILALASVITDLVFCRFFLNWLIVPFADSNGNLPKYLKWFQTFDATLDQGMYERRAELASGSGDDWSDFNPYPSSWWETYKNRAFWLFRNSAYGFDYYVYGLKWNKSDWSLVKYEVSDARTLFIATSSSGFNIFYWGPLGMYKIGWKAWNLFTPNGPDQFGGIWGDQTHVPIVFSVSPFKRK